MITHSEIITKQRGWCQAAEIKSTPAIFINGAGSQILWYKRANVLLRIFAPDIPDNIIGVRLSNQLVCKVV